MGLLKGLKLAKGKGVRECIIEGDSLTVINWGGGTNMARGGCTIISLRLGLSLKTWMSSYIMSQEPKTL